MFIRDVSHEIRSTQTFPIYYNVYMFFILNSSFSFVFIEWIALTIIITFTNKGYMAKRNGIAIAHRPKLTLIQMKIKNYIVTCLSLFVFYIRFSFNVSVINILYIYALCNPLNPLFLRWGWHSLSLISISLLYLNFYEKWNLFKFSSCSLIIVLESWKQTTNKKKICEKSMEKTLFKHPLQWTS